MIQSENIVVAENLVKRFKTLTAVNGIDFTIRTGECFGMLGPNGAGKTTTVKMIYCFLPVSSGRLTVMDLDVMKDTRKIKAVTGVCPQEDNLDPDFTVEKNLYVFSRYFGMKPKYFRERIESLLEFAQLTGKRTEKVDNLSGGMKRRLLLARALLNQPRLLILDEPTTGLDPQARHLIWDRVRALKKEGVTIILTTHYMEEAEQLCDRLLFIDQGKIIELGEPETIVEKHAGREVLELLDINDAQRHLMEESDHAFEYVGSRALLYGTALKGVVDELQQNGAGLDRVILRPSNLEDVFLKLTGRGLRE